ncbi:MAG: ferritin-like domain-containing protein [Ekhidna sp.]|uniref:ferritin-like domain-containing protein n=1 Tax=Ekhidna sp. TaxID=2608089 RepID=UPI0032ED2C28
MIHSSIFWQNHFKKNSSIQRVNWNIASAITEHEKNEIVRSLKAWQLGETSDGSHLLAAAKKYSKSVNEPEYPAAIQLFIKEEQKHGNNLGRYIDLIGEQRIKKDWGDTLFRKVRYFNTSMELWTISVIIVESAAQIFYQALKDATKCPLLKSICDDILIDEAHHIKFQNERLYKIFERKSFYNKAFSIGWYGILFFVTIHAVWFGHSRAFKAGGIVKREFMKRMYYKFFNSLKFTHSDFSITSISELAPS